MAPMLEYEYILEDCQVIQENQFPPGAWDFVQCQPPSVIDSAFLPEMIKTGRISQSELGVLSQPYPTTYFPWQSLSRVTNSDKRIDMRLNLFRSIFEYLNDSCHQCSLKYEVLIPNQFEIPDVQVNGKNLEDRSITHLDGDFALEISVGLPKGYALEVDLVDDYGIFMSFPLAYSSESKRYDGFFRRKTFDSKNINAQITVYPEQFFEQSLPVAWRQFQVRNP